MKRVIEWSSIETVLLDMDGTLLDLHFDNYFWLEHVPLRFAQKRGMEIHKAREELMSRFAQVAGRLEWYCLDYWSRELDLDLPQLQEEISDRIRVQPYVRQFLKAVRRQGKRRVLVTNAHGKTLALKMRITGLDRYLDALVCAHDHGLPKENPGFWDSFRKVEPFDPSRALLIDDNRSVLEAAARYGIRHLVGVLRPDSRRPPRQVDGFPSVADFREILPG